MLKCNLGQHTTFILTFFFFGGGDYRFKCNFLSWTCLATCKWECLSKWECQAIYTLLKWSLSVFGNWGTCMHVYATAHNQYIIQYIIVVISKLLLAGKNVQLQLSRQLRFNLLSFIFVEQSIRRPSLLAGLVSFSWSKARCPWLLLQQT